MVTYIFNRTIVKFDAFNKLSASNFLHAFIIEISTLLIILLQPILIFINT